MLLVSRFENQSIMIGENIEVKVSRIEGKSVCLGIIAPKNISIHKKEFINHLKSIFKKEK